MLRRVLTEIARGHHTDVTRLAKRLGTSEALMRQILQALEQMGYLRHMADVCPPSCKQCPVRHRCSALWQLTPRGRQVIEKAPR